MIKCILIFIFLSVSFSSHSQIAKEWDNYSQKGDTRKVRGPNSPKWLEAIGSFRGKDYQGSYNCSIVLVGNEDTISSVVAITNYHCIENVIWRYNRETLHKAAKIIFTSNSGKKISTYIKDIYDKGNYYHDSPYKEDYAILILENNNDLKKIKPLLAEYDNAFNYRDYIFDKEYDNDKEMIESRRTYKEYIAGYSGDKDEHLGNSGNNLTYDDNCISNEEDYFIRKFKNLSPKKFKGSEEDLEIIEGTFFLENCYAYPGASGGAMVIEYRGYEYYDSKDFTNFVYLLGINRGASFILNNEGQYDRSYRNIIPLYAFDDNLESAILEYNTQKKE